MMDCVQIASLIENWEQNQRISPLSLEGIKAHLASCPVCTRRYGFLLPLLERDAGLLGQVHLPLNTRTAPGTDTIMAGIHGLSSPYAKEKWSGSRHRFFRGFVPWVAAAALLVLLPLGYFVYTGRNADMVTVRFVLEAPGARTVMVSGNFNQWSSIGIPLKPQGDGKTWSTTVKLKRSFEYRYNFVIDNQTWIADPNAAVSIDDDFGGKVSLLDL
jgi:hypothetical protein